MSQPHHLLLACFKVSAPCSFHGQERKAWRTLFEGGTGTQAVLPTAPNRAAGHGEEQAWEDTPGATPEQQAVQQRWRPEGQIPLSGPSPSVPTAEAAAAQDHSLEIKYGKSCGSRASVLSYVVKFHQSSFPLQCYLDLQCPSEHSECRTAELLQEQEGRRSRALHHLLLYHDDGYCENWEAMQGFFCGAIWKHLKTPLCVLIAGLLYSSNAFKHQHPATHGDCVNIILSIVLSASF